MPFIEDHDGRKVIPCLVGGKSVPLVDAKTFPIIQSSTGEAIHLAQSANAKIAVAAVDAAAEAFKKWSCTSARE